MKTDEIDKLLDECKEEDLERDKREHRMRLIAYLCRRGKIKKPAGTLFKKVCPECGGKLAWEKIGIAGIIADYKHTFCTDCSYEFVEETLC